MELPLFESLSVYVPFCGCFLKAGVLPVLFTILPLMLRKVLAHRVVSKNMDFEARMPELQFHLNILKLQCHSCSFQTWSRAPQLAEGAAWK